MSTDDDFDFDFDVPVVEGNGDSDLANIDKNFLDSIQAKTTDSSCDKANDAFTFWFLILLLVLFMFALTFMVVFMVRGRRKRAKYEEIGYRE